MPRYTGADLVSSNSGVKRSTPAQYFWWITGTTVLLGGLWYFYRGFFRSGFQLTQGDNGDGRLTEVIAGHWRDPFQFAGGLTDTGIFFPFGQGLMYSDTLMPFGLSTIPLVAVGIDPSIAFQWALILTSAVGFVSVVALLRLGPRAPWPIAITAAFIASFSNGLVVASNHPQLLVISLVPTVGLTYLLALRATATATRVPLGAAAGALFGLITYSTFSIGWFAVTGGILTLVIWSLIAGWRAPLRQLLGHRAQIFLAAVVGTVPFLILLVATYGPLLASGAGRSVEEMRLFALGPRDLLGVSPTNVVWFRPLYALFGAMSDTERAMAPTPLLLVTGLGLVLFALRSPKRREPWLALATSTLLAGFLLWFSPVVWGDFFPWQYLTVIPGADAIRAIGRVELMAGLMITIGGATSAAILLRSFRPSALSAVAGFSLLLLLTVEQANFLVQQQVNVQAVKALRSLDLPSKECASFVLLPPFPAERTENGQIDAMIIAQQNGVPTWNGASGGVPTGWNLWMDRPELEYTLRVDTYAADQDITAYCTVSTGEDTWQLVKSTDQGVKPNS